MAKETLNLGYTPSEHQQKVFDFVRHGAGNGMIKAVAGSGKTTTIVSAMQLVPKRLKCLFIAFNKSIVDELQSRLMSYSNCTVKTIHSLGFIIVKRNLGSHIEVDEFKYRTYIKKHINDLSSIDPNNARLSPAAIREYVDSITKLVDFARFNCAQTSAEVRGVAVKYGIPLSYDECDVAVKCLNWGKNNTDTIDYTDMVWLPYELSLRPMGCQFDWIFADEVQDFSKMAVELFFRCFKRGTRFICVGDTNQAINMFAGSSPDAFETLCGYQNTQMFTLPITYRCAKKIVEIARNFSPDTVARENAPDGQILTDCRTAVLKSGDMVLCRSKAPLMNLYIKLLKTGKPCYVKGMEMGRDLLNLIDIVDDSVEPLNASLEKDGLFVRLYEYMLDERDKLMRNHNLDIDDATLSSYVMGIYDSIGSLIALSAWKNTRDELVQRINNMFDENNNGICLSTIHKAKGLEAERVFILCNSSMPSSLAKQDWEKEQERNLQYVAYTRPKNVLGFVSEKEIPPCASLQQPQDILNDVRNIEMAVCRVTGREPSKNILQSEFSRFKIKHATNVNLTETLHNKTDDTFIAGEQPKTIDRLAELEHLMDD